MAPWRALFLCTPLTAPLLMKLWWDKELQARWVCVRLCVSVCTCVSAYADPCLFWLPRQQCLTPMALSCLEREELLLPSVEKVRNQHVLVQIHIRISLVCKVCIVYTYKQFDPSFKLLLMSQLRTVYRKKETDTQLKTRTTKLNKYG